MKKITSLAVLTLALFSLASCNGPKWLAWIPGVHYEEKADVEISAELSFYSDCERKSRLATTDFEKDKPLFIGFDFSIHKNISKEESVSFAVHFPHSECYSTLDFSSGIRKPYEKEEKQKEEDGLEYKVKEFGKRDFVLSDTLVHNFSFSFKREANQPCQARKCTAFFKCGKLSTTIGVNGQIGTSTLETGFSFH